MLCASRRLNIEWKHVCYWGPAAVWLENVCGCGFVLAVGNNSVKADILAVGTDVPMSKRLSGDFMTTCELLVQQVVTHAASKEPGKRTGLLVSSTMRIPQIVVYANHGPNKGNAEYWISPSMWLRRLTVVAQVLRALRATFSTSTPRSCWKKEMPGRVARTRRTSITAWAQTRSAAAATR